MSIIERLRELEKDATGPKWVVGFSDGSGERWMRTDEDSIIVISGVEDSWGLPQGVLSPADAALIAEARNHLSALLDVAEQMQREHKHHHIPGTAACYGCGVLARLEEGAK